MIKSMTLRNYRSIGAEGATLSLENGFTAVIGVNNSGKSVLLKSIYELRNIFNLLANANPGGSEIQLLCTSGLQFSGLSLLPGERIFPSYDDSLNPEVTLRFDNSRATTDISEIKVIFSPQFQIKMKIKLQGANYLDISQFLGLQNDAHGNTLNLVNLSDGNSHLFDWSSIRSDLLWLTSSLYVGPFRNAINSGGAPYYDIEVGKDFLLKFDEFATGPRHEENDAVLNMCQELATIFGMRSLQVSISNDNQSLKVSVDGKSFMSSELGSGFTQFIIVAVNVLVKKRKILLIDEPELNLHASLQMQFLKLLAKYTEGPVIFATHSLGLARSMTDKILLVRRSEQGRTQVSDYKMINNISHALGELGYGGLNDSAFKAVLLVEGSTDVLVFQSLLAKYGIFSQVLIVSLGGDLIATNRELELKELSRISEHTFAVIDSEKQAPDEALDEKRAGFKEICAEQHISCHVLERRATENYLDQDVARLIFRKPNAEDFGPFEKWNESWSWDKNKNWKIAEGMSLEAIEGTDLGLFLSRIAQVVDDRN